MYDCFAVCDKLIRVVCKIYYFVRLNIECWCWFAYMKFIRQKRKCRWFGCLFYNLKMMAESNDCFCWIDTSCDKMITPVEPAIVFQNFLIVFLLFKKTSFCFYQLSVKDVFEIFLSVYEPVCGPVCHPGLRKCFSKFSHT